MYPGPPLPIISSQFDEFLACAIHGAGEFTHPTITVLLSWLCMQYRLFEQIMTTLPADGSEDLPLILSACKCLDLLLVLQTEEFQVYVRLHCADPFFLRLF